MSAKDHVFTLGIEEACQIIDPETRELRSHIQEILAGGKMLLKEQVKAEMHQSVVELGTEVCDDTTCAREQVIKLRSELAREVSEKSIGTRIFFRRRICGTSSMPSVGSTS